MMHAVLLIAEDRAVAGRADTKRLADLSVFGFRLLTNAASPAGCRPNESCSGFAKIVCWFACSVLWSRPQQQIATAAAARSGGRVHVDRGINNDQRSKAQQSRNPKTQTT
jgi:hypothetical protein